MKEQLITFETAKLAKEKGFNEYSTALYFEDDKVLRNNLGNWNNIEQDKDTPHISAPTQSLLQKWIREKHNIHIGIILVVKTLGIHEFAAQELLWRFEIVAINGKYDSRDTSSKERYTIYEDALEQGLQEALKHL